MNITTNSIIDIVEITCNKFINEITSEDLLKINSLIISRFDVAGNIININFEDLKFFPMLKELVINNCILSGFEMQIIKNLRELKSLTINTCELDDESNNILKEIFLDNLTIINSRNLDFNSINDLIYLKVSDMSFVDTNKKINKLDLSLSNNDISTYNDLNVNELVISYDLYNNNQKFFDEKNYKVTVMQDNGTNIYKVVGHYE